MVAEVTVIVATYNRPDVLQVAIQSVLNQTISNWHLLIIGDACTKETAALINTIQDDRITFINLPENFGEQSGPNSVGMALAKTEYISFLNQDDVYLPEHLEVGLASLKKSKSDFFIAAKAESWQSDKNFELWTNAIRENYQNPAHSFFLHLMYFEPASAWILTRKASERLKRWNSAKKIWRTPVSDFILRACRLKLKFCFSSLITVWRITIHPKYENKIQGDGRGSYQHSSIEHQYVLKNLLNKSGDQIRSYIDSRIKETTVEKYMLNHLNLIRKLVLNRMTRWLYFTTGIDSLVIFQKYLLRKKRGFKFDDLSKKRVGSSLPPTPSLDEAIGYARKNH